MNADVGLNDVDRWKIRLAATAPEDRRDSILLGTAMNRVMNIEECYVVRLLSEHTDWSLDRIGAEMDVDPRYVEWHVEDHCDCDHDRDHYADCCLVARKAWPPSEDESVTDFADRIGLSFSAMKRHAFGVCSHDGKELLEDVGLLPEPCEDPPYTTDGLIR